MASICDASSSLKENTRKEYYKENPDAKMKEKERLREKRRLKRQATGETQAWFQKSRGQQEKP